MKHAKGLALAAFLGALTALSSTYYALEVKGGSRVFSVDQPVRKGRVYVFHRFPDGVYMSLSASEVSGVTALSEAPQPEGLAPGQSKFVGGAMPGPSYEAPPGAAAAQAPVPDYPYQDNGYGYGYYGSYWGGGGGHVPPRPQPVPPSRIGPNGFPILAPPGSPGSTSPPIGPNGFPILAPPPPVAQPRRP